MVPRDYGTFACPGRCPALPYRMGQGATLDVLGGGAHGPLARPVGAHPLVMAAPAPVSGAGGASPRQGEVVAVLALCRMLATLRDPARVVSAGAVGYVPGAISFPRCLVQVCRLHARPVVA